MGHGTAIRRIMKAFTASLACVWLLVAAVAVHGIPLANEEASVVKKNDTSLYDYLTDAAVSTVVCAALGEDDCLRRSACEAGNYVSEVSGKEIVLMMLDRWAPTSWQNTVRAFKEAATYKDDCKKQFPCSIKADKE